MMHIVTLKTITTSFTNELTMAQGGRKTSLPFLVHQLSLKPQVSRNEIFEVIRIGGSIYQKAFVAKKLSTLVVLEKQQARLPRLETARDFFHFIERYFEKNTSYMALNFAYPMKPIFRNNVLDGKLLNGTKEHAFRGLLGKNVGEEIEAYVYGKTRRKITVSVANDTICLLLSGLIKYPWDRVVGGVIGTGLNFALFLDSHHAVNLESAFFDKFKPSPEGKIIDHHSKNKGTSLFEKEVSGGYLYQHFNLRAKRLGISHQIVTGTIELDAIAKNGDPATPLARELFERSASLIACQMAGITRFLGRDLIFVMEGSLFWDGWKFKDNVDKYLKLLVPEYKIKFRFIEDSGILGAAKLVA